MIPYHFEEIVIDEKKSPIFTGGQSKDHVLHLSPSFPRIIHSLTWQETAKCGVVQTTRPAQEDDHQTLTTQPNKKPQLDSEAPLEFPTNQSSQHPFVLHNATIRDNLANHSDETELESLRAMIRATEVITLSYNNSNTGSVIIDQPDKVEVLKSNVELIENGDNTEDAMVLKKMSEQEDVEEAYPVFKGQVAGILAGTFLVVSVLAYLGLLSWRRYLEIKYGSREMLVNEEDFVVHHDDLKNFSL